MFSIHPLSTDLLNADCADQEPIQRSEILVKHFFFWCGAQGGGNSHLDGGLGARRLQSEPEEAMGAVTRLLEAGWADSCPTALASLFVEHR